MSRARVRMSVLLTSLLVAFTVAPAVAGDDPAPGSPAYVARDVQNIANAYGRVTGPGAASWRTPITSPR
jgi:hypothetical protein